MAACAILRSVIDILCSQTIKKYLKTNRLENEIGSPMEGKSWIPRGGGLK